MYIIEVCSGVHKEAIIKAVEPSDFVRLRAVCYSKNIMKTHVFCWYLRQYCSIITNISIT